MKPIHVRYGFYGLVFGFILSRMGFGDFAEVHNMFVFADMRLFLAFCGGVGLSMVGFVVVAKWSRTPQRSINRGSVFGGILFGMGWAFTGACPSIILVQLGEGQVPAIATLVGAVVGIVVYPHVHRRFFGWDMGACSV